MYTMSVTKHSLNYAHVYVNVDFCIRHLHIQFSITGPSPVCSSSREGVCARALTRARLRMSRLRLRSIRPVAPTSRGKF